MILLFLVGERVIRPVAHFVLCLIDKQVAQGLVACVIVGQLVEQGLVVIRALVVGAVLRLFQVLAVFRKRCDESYQTYRR